MPDEHSDSHTTAKSNWHSQVKKPIKQALTLIIIFALVYFTSQAIQTFLGKRAAQATGLPEISLQNALKQAQLTHKPLLVNVSAYWCPACRKLDREVLSTELVKNKIQSDYIFTRVDFDSKEGQAFVEKYEIKGTPTLLVLDKNADVLRWIRLSFNPEQFISQL